MSPARAVSLLVATLGAVVAATGCGGSQSATSAPRGPLVVLSSGGARTLVVGRAGAPRALPAGDTAPGTRTLFTARVRGAATTVAALDLRTGRPVASTRLAGSWRLPVTVAGGAPDALSPTGSTLVLVGSAAGRSRFALLDSGLRRAPRVVTLPGRFAYDAVAPEAGLLYLVERLGAGHYAVRAYDLARAALRPGAIVDKREADEPMEGLPVARASRSDGGWVYTLYRRAGDVPFVHALAAADGYALCLDLPRAARSGLASAREWGLVLAPSQRTLYAANPALGLLVELSTEQGVRRVARLPRGALGATPRLAVSRDGTSLWVPSTRGVLEVDTTTLRLRRTLLAGHAASAVVAAGPRLVVQGGGVVTLDARSGRVLARAAAPAPDTSLTAVVAPT
jgi:hypothetical protein